MNSDGYHPVSELGDESAIVTAREAFKDIAFGSIAGMISEVFEYPFDLAKVRLQSQMLTPASENIGRRFDGPLDCLMQTWRDEGFKGLYRGLPAPLIGSMAETAALFFAYSSFQNVIRAYSFRKDPQESSLQLSIPQLGLAAAGAGFVTSFILTPIELVKCKMQVQMMNHHTSAHIPPIHSTPKPIKQIVNQTQPLSSPSSSRSPLSTLARTISTPVEAEAYRRRLPGPMSIIRTVVHDHGVRGLWLGHTGTLLRETGGTASWFVLKEWLASEFKTRRLGQGVPGELLPWESAVSGAISGAACVLALYPADTVKSAMQTEEELRSQLGKKMTKGPTSFYRTATRMYSMHGIRGLYAGCGMTAVRAVPSSGIVFLVYDGLNSWFSRL
ncbi:L-ornithine transporter [Desarmillaria tabescens]|uniref:L-ornithine transporter n=1 Tax=Armillaria tabescens TaxID=1929756 RepID=A0AA39MU88_ARMTA|nr:L-ornithine transporter [Desarmillaria tabescens]KAK0446000.1 L-ornithine transporter [Desarmillaria tabescens]